MIAFLTSENRPAHAASSIAVRGPGRARYDGTRAPTQSLTRVTPAGARPRQLAGHGGYGVPGSPARRLPAASRKPAGVIADGGFSAYRRPKSSSLVIDVVRVFRRSLCRLPTWRTGRRKILGHAIRLARTWAACGFLNFLNSTLPEAIKLTDKPPHFRVTIRRHRTARAGRGEQQPKPQRSRKDSIVSLMSPRRKLTELQNSYHPHLRGLQGTRRRAAERVPTSGRL